MDCLCCLLKFSACREKALEKLMGSIRGPICRGLGGLGDQRPKSPTIHARCRLVKLDAEDHSVCVHSDTDHPIHGFGLGFYRVDPAHLRFQLRHLGAHTLCDFFEVIGLVSHWVVVP
ncbi:Uncharacterised protein [Mycobacteroides abscessus subsp. bolletii]|nr:Uncharacterised protein [Mycobacteroides abscessus subsp. bolletii]